MIASLPWLVRAGFSLLALGGGADLGYHAINGLETHTHGGPSLFAFAIHLVAALGMVLSIVGVFGEGIRSTRRSAAGRRNR